MWYNRPGSKIFDIVLTPKIFDICLMLELYPNPVSDKLSVSMYLYCVKSNYWENQSLYFSYAHTQQ